MSSSCSVDRGLAIRRGKHIIFGEVPLCVELHCEDVILGVFSTCRVRIESYIHGRYE